MAAAVGGALLTVATLLVPSLHFAYRNPDLHVALNAVEAVIGLLVAYLAFGRFAQTSSWNDAALTVALGILGLTNLLFAVVPIVVTSQNGGFSIWAPLTARLIASLVFAAAAVRAFRVVRNHHRTAIVIVVTCVAVLALVGTPLALLADDLPPGVEGSLPPDASRAHIEGNQFVLVAQGAQMLLYTAAAFGFARKRRELNEEFFTWVAAAAVLAAFARLNYVLYPSLYSDFIYTGDILRLGSHLLFVVGAVREIQSYWQARAEALVIRQRNLIARDLHDGLAQELTFIATQLRVMAKQSDGPGINQLAGSADRAVAEARRAITALSRGSEERLADALTEIAEETARREGGWVRLELDETVRVDSEVKEAGVRIVREAVLNALRHSGTPSVAVELRGEESALITVADEGRGFVPGKSADGLGLATMEARAAAVGGGLETISSPGKGTIIKIVLPLSET